MTRKSFKPNSWMFPCPVLLIGTYDNKGKPDLMNAAWGGIYDTNQVIICLSSDHKTTKNILKNKCFTISFAEQDKVIEADYVGCISGNKEDKISKLNLHYHSSRKIKAPLFDEFKIILECKVNKLEDDGETMHVIGDIVNISVREDIIKDNKVDVTKFNPLAFNPIDNSYRVVGKKVDNAFKCFKKFKGDK